MRYDKYKDKRGEKADLIFYPGNAGPAGWRLRIYDDRYKPYNDIAVGPSTEDVPEDELPSREEAIELASKEMPEGFELDEIID